MTLDWRRSFEDLREDGEVLLACLVHILDAETGRPAPAHVQVLARWHPWPGVGHQVTCWWQLTLNNEPLPGYYVPYAWADTGELPAYEAAP